MLNGTFHNFPGKCQGVQCHPSPHTNPAHASTTRCTNPKHDAHSSRRQHNTTQPQAMPDSKKTSTKTASHPRQNHQGSRISTPQIPKTGHPPHARGQRESTQLIHFPNNTPQLSLPFSLHLPLACASDGLSRHTSPRQFPPGQQCV